MMFGPAHGFSSMVVYDYNNDGYRDFLGLPNNNTRKPQLFHNRPDVLTPEFVELPPEIGLSDLGYVHGAVAADFGGPGSTYDGLTDLYLGRPVSSDAFYFKSDLDQTSQAETHYVAVRLVGEPDSVNRDCIGAKVEVQAGGISQVQIVDGGSMRGSQTYRDLVFGLGEESSSATATITWPNGDVWPNMSLEIDKTNVIESWVRIIEGSVVGSYEVNSDGTVNWVFEWDVNVDIPPHLYLDTVTFDMASIPTDCMPNTSIVTRLSRSTRNEDNDYFHHKVKLENRECVPKCNIPFKVKSSNGVTFGESDSYTLLRIRICVGL